MSTEKSKGIIKGKVYNDADFDRMASGMKKVFGEMKKRSIRIPIDQLNPAENGVPVCVNGYTFVIKRGVTVEVPEEIAKILERANYI